MNNLDHRIKEYFKAPKPKRKEEFINSLAPSEISFARFVISQAGYIRKLTWILFSLVIVGIAAVPFILDSSVIWFVSGLMPLLALLMVSESNRSIRYKMAEIESATRFSLRSVLLARMVLMGTVNLVAIVIAIPVSTHFGDYSAVASGLYIVTPFLVAASAGLYIVRVMKGNTALYSVAAVSLFISLFMFLSRDRFTSIFIKDAVKYWGLIALLALVAMVKQTAMLIKNTEEITWNW